MELLAVEIVRHQNAKREAETRSVGLPKTAAFGICQVATFSFRTNAIILQRRKPYHCKTARLCLYMKKKLVLFCQKGPKRC